MAIYNLAYRVWLDLVLTHLLGCDSITATEPTMQAPGLHKLNLLWPF